MLSMSCFCWVFRPVYAWFTTTLAAQVNPIGRIQAYKQCIQNETATTNTTNNTKLNHPQAKPCQYNVGLSSSPPSRSVTEWVSRAHSRFAPSQWETSLQSNAVTHWLGTNLESALSQQWQSAKISLQLRLWNYSLVTWIEINCQQLRNGNHVSLSDFSRGFSTGSGCLC